VLIADGELDTTGSPTIVTDNSHRLETPEMTDLLARNQQLATLLAERDQTVGQLRASLDQLVSRSLGCDTKRNKTVCWQQTQAKSTEEELQQSLTDAERKWSGEVSALREQLQLHTQTVGILVADKTEAQAALSRAQLAAKTKTG
jgi:hypothetical protein